MKQSTMLRSSLLAVLLAGNLQAEEHVNPIDDQMLIDHLAQQDRSERLVFDEYFRNEKYAMTAASDCSINTGFTITPDEPMTVDIQSLFVNQLNADTGCFASMADTFDETRDDWAILLRVDAQHLAEPDLEKRDAHKIWNAAPALRISAADTQVPAIDRSLSLNGETQPFNQALVVVSNACNDIENCLPEFSISANDVAASVDLTVEGIYTRPESSDQLESNPLSETAALRSASSTEFVNGNFENFGTGWTWRTGWHTGFGIPGDCGDLNYPTPSTVLQTRVFQGTTNAYAWHGGGYGTSLYDPPRVKHFDLSQTVTVPASSNLKFHHRSVRARENGIYYATTTRVLAHDLTTGQKKLLKKITNHSNTPFASYTINVSEFAGHLVNFRFYSCGEVQNNIGSVGIYGKWYVDNVRFEELPINSSARPKSGLWHDFNNPGSGLHISKNGNNDYSVFWYTYTSAGKPIWYMSDSGPMSNGVWNKTLYKVSWSTSSQTANLQPYGNIRLEMTSNETLRFKWNLNHINGSNGFDGTIDMNFFQGGYGATGNWFEPQYSGWGVSVSYENRPGPDTVALAFIYDGSQPVWTIGTMDGAPTSVSTIGMSYVTSPTDCPGCSGTGSPLYQDAGDIGLWLNGNTTGRGWTDLHFPSNREWNRGRSNNMIFLSRITGN